MEVRDSLTEEEKEELTANGCKIIEYSIGEKKQYLIITPLVSKEEYK